MAAVVRNLGVQLSLRGATRRPGFRVASARRRSMAAHKYQAHGVECDIERAPAVRPELPDFAAVGTGGLQPPSTCVSLRLPLVLVAEKMRSCAGQFLAARGGKPLDADSMVKELVRGR